MEHEMKTVLVNDVREFRFFVDITIDENRRTGLLDVQSETN